MEIAKRNVDTSGYEMGRSLIKAITAVANPAAKSGVNMIMQIAPLHSCSPFSLKMFPSIESPVRSINTKAVM